MLLQIVRNLLIFVFLIEIYSLTEICLFLKLPYFLYIYNTKYPKLDIRVAQNHRLLRKMSILTRALRML